MREIDILLVVRQLGIEPSRVHNWLSAQGLIDEIACASLEGQSADKAISEHFPETAAQNPIT
ncbi:hypothetical protein GCM10008018_00820 [Paenibacillus marchantiophytorum]|uniref:Uncharacterized protein n=1 Tax=Paenibacillus marchantiophytorum TaxID=1619310 RepID=A0ABQ2BPV0_9BACL|nr:hypothetical protein [Paenibacillus marchantiophytorum]GGI43191.1 hypothetical protein GCM10008018_00820 [Paenibacillus marchantiophytorum]